MHTVFTKQLLFAALGMGLALPPVFGRTVENAAALKSWSDADSCPVYTVERKGKGRGNVVQSHAFDFKNKMLYTLHVTGSPGQAVVNRVPLKGGSLKRSAAASEPSDKIGHQGLGVQYLADGSVRLWASVGRGVPQRGRKAVRFAYRDNGSVGEVQEFQLFEDHYARAGKSSLSEVRVFDLSELTRPGDYSRRYRYRWFADEAVKSEKGSNTYLQPLASDGRMVYLLAGFHQADMSKLLYAYTLDGRLLAKNDRFLIGNADAKKNRQQLPLRTRRAGF